MENNKNKKSVKFQGDMLNFYDFIQVFIFTTNYHLKTPIKFQRDQPKTIGRFPRTKYLLSIRDVCADRRIDSGQG